MKILFLDIDGVLNCAAEPEARKIKRAMGSKLSDRCMNNLNHIIRRTGALVVVSSTWRIGETVESIQAKLEAEGFIGEVVGITPRGCSCCLRGNEILKWIKDNEDLLGVRYYDFNSYVILDDDSDMLYWQRDNFFWVDPWGGLTNNIAYKVINKLGVTEGVKTTEEAVAI